MRKILSLKEFVDVLSIEREYYIKFPNQNFVGPLRYDEIISLPLGAIIEHILDDRMYVNKLIIP